MVATAHDPSRLLRCLASIKRGAGTVPHEVVVVLSGADDDVVDAVRVLPGVRIAESRWNLGFAGACNLGRTQASGELIVLLHDDAEAEAGWLPSLVDSAERHPEAGVIGSRVVERKDGRLQLAGAVIFSDASTAMLGRGADPDAPQHMVSRAVDYCSSCSLLVRAQTWDAIGGLDELLFPGGYVDADLCTAAWAAGWEVRYESLAVARHRAGGSTSSGFKAFIAQRNREHFRTKWAAELERYEPPGADVEAAAKGAVARAEARAEELRSRPRPRSSSAQTGAADADLGPRLATLELRLLREYVAIADSELERVHGEYQSVRHRLVSADAELENLRGRAAALDAILAGGWWRLRTRLLTLLKPVWRRRRGSAPSRRPRESRTGSEFRGAARWRRR